MPRNGAGVYSLPAGNPVEPNTLIEAVWANTTLEDIGDELTNSLTRNGAGGMTGPLRLVNGSAAAPALAFTSETTLGIYRVSSGVLGIAVGGTLRASFAATGLTLAGDLDVGGAVDIVGAADIGGTLAVTDDFSIATNKFTVDAATGNTVIAGTLTVTGGISPGGDLNVPGNFSVATNKFTVAAATGNTAIAGTLAVVGDVAVNTNKFTITASNGNTFVGGALGAVGNFSINTNKFTVVASSGDTTVAGTLIVAGASAFSGNLLAGSVSINSTLAVSGDVAVNTNKFTVAAATGNTVIAGTLAVTGISTLHATNVQGNLAFDIAGGTTYSDAGYRDIELETQDAAYGFVLADRGRGKRHTSGSAHTWTIPANASVAFPIGTIISGVNTGAGVVSIAITTDTLLNSAGATGTRAVAQYGVFSLWKVNTTTWVITGSNIT